MDSTTLFPSLGESLDRSLGESLDRSLVPIQHNWGAKKKPSPPPHEYLIPINPPDPARRDNAPSRVTKKNRKKEPISLVNTGSMDRLALMRESEEAEKNELSGYVGSYVYLHELDELYCSPTEYDSDDCSSV
jgi:hypothetical protein